MPSLNRQRIARALALAGLAVAVYSASTISTTESIQAQILPGEFQVFQPHQTGVVGRAWANSDRTVEYWAYVVGEYRWPDSSNGPGNRANLQFERVGGTQYANYAAFKAAVLAMPQFQGKAVEFENHSTTREVTQN